MPRTLCRDCCEVIDGAHTPCTMCGGARIIAHDEIAELGIAHIDCDAFYASVEKRDRPELAGEPLIIGHAGGRGVVLTACYEARRFGARSAMPMYQALELCPHATVIEPDMGKYKRVSQQIRAIFEWATPIIEPLSLDEAYLDLSAEERTTGSSAAAALARIAQRVETEIGITVSIGLACNKFLAKLASELQKPRGFSVIGRGEAKAFLAPLSVRKIHGVGAVTARRMEEGGLVTIADLQTATEQQLVGRFGRFGHRLAQFAQGEDDRRVTPHRPVKSISAETTFRHDTASRARLQEIAADLCQRVAAQLVRKNVAGSSVVLKLKTSDFRILTRTRRLPHPTQRAAIIGESVASLLDREADGRTFRLIGVGIAELGSAAAADPTDLFAFAASPSAEGTAAGEAGGRA
jgi:DNA polymerase-4